MILNHYKVVKLVLPTLAEKEEVCLLHTEQVLTHNIMQEEKKMLVHRKNILCN